MDYFLIIVLFILVIILFNKLAALRQDNASLKDELRLLGWKLEDLERKIAGRSSAVTPQEVKKETPAEAHPPAPPIEPPTILLQKPEHPAHSVPYAIPEAPVTQPSQPPPPVEPPVAAAEETPVPEETPVLEEMTPVKETPPEEEPVQPPLPPMATPKRAPAKARTREEWEELIGGNIFNRIGAIAIVIGLALALLYAIQKGLITPPLRIAIGYAIGIGLLLLGYRSHRKGLPTFAQGLIGAGIAVCYLCGFASYVPAVVGAFGVKSMVSYPVAFALMTAAAILAFQQALFYDSLAVAILGWVGGFLTPFILQSGSHNVIGLFTYLVFITLGMVALAIKKDEWAVIEPLTLVATYAIYLALSHILPPDMFTSPLNAPISAIFLLIIWALFHAADLHRAYWRITTLSVLRQTFSVLNGLFLWLLLYLTLQQYFYRWIGGISLLLAVVYFAGALVYERLDRIDDQFIPRSSVAAIVLLALGTYIYQHDFLLVTFWSLEALAIFTAGRYWKRDYAWVSALGLFGVTFVRLIYQPTAFFWEPLDTFHPVINLRFLAFLTLAGGLLISAIQVKKEENEADWLRPLLHYVWSTLIFLLLAVEINDLFRSLYPSAGGSSQDWVHTAHLLTIALSWVVYSLPLAGIGIRRRIQPLIVTGYIALIAGTLLAAGQAAWLGLSATNPLAALIFCGPILLLIMLALYLHTKWAQQGREQLPWLGTIIEFFFVLIAILGFELITVEIVKAFALLSSHELIFGMAITRVEQLVLACAWAYYAVVLIVAGMRRVSAELKFCGYSILFLGAAWLAGYGLHYPPIDHFVPVLNLRTPAFIIVIIALYLTERRVREEAVLPAGFISVLQLIMSLLAFEWLTVEINAAFGLLAAGGAQGLLHLNLSQAHYLTQAMGWALFAVVLSWLAMRKRSDVMYICGLMTGALAFGTVMFVGWRYMPAKDFILLFNLRSAAFAVSIIALVCLEQLLKRSADRFPWVVVLPGISQFFLSILAFEWLTVEINAAYRLLEARGLHSLLHLNLELAHYFTLVMGWALLAVLVSWLAVRKRSDIMYVFGLLTGALAFGTLAVTGWPYEPVKDFIPVLNLRAAAFAVSILTLIFLEQLVKRSVDRFPWVAKLPGVLQFIMSLLAFQWLTVEINAVCGLLDARHMQGLLNLNLSQARSFALAMGWSLLAVLLSWLAVRKRSTVMYVFGLLTGALALSTVIIAGWTYEPVMDFILLMNLRAAAFAVAIIALLLLEQIVKRSVDRFPGVAKIPGILQIIIALLIFQWASLESWAYFSRLIALQQDYAQSNIHRLENIRQVTLSITWVVYAILLMAYGFARRMVGLRLLAMAVFELAIIKIFVFDSWSLETLYRIFAFIGLGIMLLATSYLYQRYKNLLIGLPSAPPDADDESEFHAPDAK